MAHDAHVFHDCLCELLLVHVLIFPKLAKKVTSLYNVPVRSAHGFAARTPNTKTPKYRQTSTRHNSTSMAAIDKALAAIESQELGDKIVY
jgi:hypothetical protein